MNKYYSKVPPEQVEQFMRFRQDHPIQIFTLNGITWEYFTCRKSRRETFIAPAGSTGYS